VSERAPHGGRPRAGLLAIAWHRWRYRRAKRRRGLPFVQPARPVRVHA